MRKNGTKIFTVSSCESVISSADMKRNLYGLFPPSAKFVPSLTKWRRCMCYSWSIVICTLSDNYVRLHIGKLIASCVDDDIFLILTLDVWISQCFSTGVPPKYELKCAYTHSPSVVKAMYSYSHSFGTSSAYDAVSLFHCCCFGTETCAIKYCGVFALCKNGWATETADSVQYTHQQCNNVVMLSPSRQWLSKYISGKAQWRHTPAVLTYNVTCVFCVVCAAQQ
jgi:hypothetical protein